jgi:hypothetical protein
VPHRETNTARAERADLGRVALRALVIVSRWGSVSLVVEEVLSWGVLRCSLRVGAKPS